MAISSNSKRIQLTFNSDKENEALVLDYLSKSFNEAQEIKRILFEYVVNQSASSTVKNSESKKEVIKDTTIESNSPRVTKSKTKVVKEITGEEKLLTNSQSNSEIMKDNNNNSKLANNSNSDDFTLDVSNFEDEVVEVKPANKDTILEEITQNELNELDKFK